MSRPLVYAGPLALAAVAHAAPLDRPTPYTAFPDLVAPPPRPVVENGKPVLAPDGKPLVEGVREQLSRLLSKYDRPVPADAPLVRHVRAAQLREGVEFLTRYYRMYECGSPGPQDYENYTRVLSEVFRVAAELDPTPAGRTAAYEGRVVAFKAVERTVGTLIDAGQESPHRLHLIRFWRLQAEKELLLLKDELARPPAK